MFKICCLSAAFFVMFSTLNDKTPNPIFTKYWSAYKLYGFYKSLLISFSSFKILFVDHHEEDCRHLYGSFRFAIFVYILITKETTLKARIEKNEFIARTPLITVYVATTLFLYPVRKLPRMACNHFHIYPLSYPGLPWSQSEQVTIVFTVTLYWHQISAYFS